MRPIILFLREILVNENRFKIKKAITSENYSLKENLNQK